MNGTVCNYLIFFFSWTKLESRGLRFVYRENDNKFSNDVEPEYITYNKNETKAYVCLQVWRIIFFHFSFDISSLSKMKLVFGEMSSVSVLVIPNDFWNDGLIANINKLYVSIIFLINSENIRTF